VSRRTIVVLGGVVIVSSGTCPCRAIVLERWVPSLHHDSIVCGIWSLVKANIHDSWCLAQMGIGSFQTCVKISTPYTVRDASLGVEFKWRMPSTSSRLKTTFL
jgi:hypothetical protein